MSLLVTVFWLTNNSHWYEMNPQFQHSDNIFQFKWQNVKTYQGPYIRPHSRRVINTRIINWMWLSYTRHCARDFISVWFFDVFTHFHNWPLNCPYVTVIWSPFSSFCRACVLTSQTLCWKLPGHDSIWWIASSLVPPASFCFPLLLFDFLSLVHGSEDKIRQ